MLSIYSSLYNLSANIFDWQRRLIEFRDFADEVCVATSTDCKDDSVEVLSKFCFDNNIKCVVTDIKFSDYAFDGKLKNAALKACSGEFCTLLDIDEAVSPKFRDSWRKLAFKLEKSEYDAVFVPVIDLFHDLNHFRSLGQKWYIHKNKPNIERGIVNFAKLDNGKILHTKSDSAELIYSDGNLVKSVFLINPNLDNNEKLTQIRQQNCPVVKHFGWLNKEQRLKQQAFWNPVWSNRAGFEVNTEIDFDKIEYWPHNLEI